MRRYFFDMRDGKHFLVDEEGVECRDLQAVKTEAARALADMARDAAHEAGTASLQDMSIEVRDDSGPVMLLRFSFEISGPSPGTGT